MWQQKIICLKENAISKLALMLFTTGLACGSDAFAGQGNSGAPDAVFIGGISQPVFDVNMYKEDYYVVTELDTDLNGENDIVHVQIFRSKDTERGAVMPVILAPSPYYDSDVQSSRGFENAFYDGLTESLYDGSPDFNDLSELIFSDNQRHQNKRTLFDNRRDTDISYLTSRGFIMGFVEVLGTGQSTGCPMTNITNDGMALKSVVDWLNGNAIAYDKGGKEAAAYWTNGKVGTYGGSYRGYMVNALAATGVEALKFGITAVSVSDFYSYYRANGAPRDPTANFEFDVSFFTERSDMISLYEFIASKGLLSRDCQHMRAEIQAGQDRITGNRNDWWDTFTVLPYLDSVNAHMLVIAGLRDNNVRTSQSIDLYGELRDQGKDVKLFLHPGGHQSYFSYSFLNLALGSKYLYDQVNFYNGFPPVYIFRAGGSSEIYTDFPDPLAVDTVFRPQSDGLLLANAEPFEVVQEIIDDRILSTYDLLDMPVSNARLIFKTPVLTSDVKISGTPRINMNLAVVPVNPNPAATTVAANLSLAIADVAADGSFSIITRGWMNPQNRDSNYFKTPLEADQFVDLAFDMEPNDHIFKAGRQIALMIYSTDNAAHVMPTPGTLLKVDLGKTSMTVGVVGALP